MGFNGGLMGFNRDLLGFNRESMGYEWDIPGLVNIQKTIENGPVMVDI